VIADDALAAMFAGSGACVIRPERDAERIAARAQARKSKDFKAADAIRDELRARGVEIEDTPQGTKWRV